ncbi:MAG: hypothetical protein AAF725_23350 [Acidobacteriota bacterium]
MSRSSQFNARVCLILGLFLLIPAASASAAEHWLSLGAHFFRTLDDLADDGFDDIEDDGYAIVLGYTYKPRGLFYLAGEIEYYPDGFGGSTDGSVVPIGYAGIGGSWYAAVGLGATFSGDFDDNVSDPFYLARLGKRFDVLPGVGVDIYLNYRADAFDALEDASTDTITLGGAVRFNIF